MALRLGELLKSKGFVSDAQLNVAMAQQTITGDLLGDTLVKLAFVSSREMAQVLAEQAGTEFLDLFEYPPTDEALRLVPRDIAEKTGFLPLSVGEKGIAIGVTNLTNILAIDTAAKLTGKPPRVYMVDSDSFYATLERAYYFLENPIHKRIDAIVNDIKNAVAQTAATVASLSEMIIMDGIKRNATDIHIMPAAETSPYPLQDRRSASTCQMPSKKHAEWNCVEDKDPFPVRHCGAEAPPGRVFYFFLP